MSLLSGILLILLGAVCLGCWIHGLLSWDGANPCTPEDCDKCPFPRCEEKGIVNKNQTLKGETSND